MSEQKHVFKSGASSGELKAPYHQATGFGAKVTALRFGYGNAKHEGGTTLFSEANWLKAFHARDLAFFRDRMNHAREHLHAESQGNFDNSPGGNWGAVGWCVDVMPFVKEYDPDFYNAVVGIAPLPSERRDACRCPRCEARLLAKLIECPKCLKNFTTLEGCGLCDDCCTCL